MSKDPLAQGKLQRLMPMIHDLINSAGGTQNVGLGKVLIRVEVNMLPVIMIEMGMMITTMIISTGP